MKKKGVNMTKQNFIELIQERSDNNITRKDAEEALTLVLGSIRTVLESKDSLSLVGFGTFSTVEVAEKSGTVPGTTKTYTKAAHTAPKFKVSKALKDAVAGN